MKSPLQSSGDTPAGRFVADPRPSHRPRPSRRPAVLVGVGVLALVAPIAALAVFIASFLGGAAAADTNPLAGRSFYTNPASLAALAAAAALAEGPTGTEGATGSDTSTGNGGANRNGTTGSENSSGSSQTDAATFARIAAVPTATWLVPERNPVASVETDVAAIADAAAARDELPIFVIYGIPGRDCGNYSAGGLSDADYPIWAQAIAEALQTRDAVVIVEPDALALASSCGTVDRSVAHVKETVTALAPTRATVYLDAGHSDWIAAADIAALLTRAGIDQARGFATNVSNFNTSAEERVFAEAVSRLTNDAHYVVDTGRNGNGSSGEWCNPAGRSLGALPAAAGTAAAGASAGGAATGTAGEAHDGDLWIKPPGESDGLCNGGPAAGAWWAEAALELAAGAGW